LTVTIAWDKIVDKDVKSIDDKDIGKIKNLFQDHVHIESGLVSKDSYSVPKSFVERYEDDKVFLSLTKDEVKEKFKDKSD
jgi:hypothetical protein